MREIKFRAWLPNSKEQEKMVYDIGVVRGKPYFENSRIVYEGGKNTDRDGSNNYKFEFYLMQFTGSKDKNNKEIYEGDIVKYNEKTWEVRWVYAGFWLIIPEELKDIELTPAELQFMKVIGNIYENKELL